MDLFTHVLLSGFQYGKAFWLAVICPLSMDFAMAFFSCLLKESGFSSTLIQSGKLFHFSAALTAK
jgi:hypothetical protein